MSNTRDVRLEPGRKWTSGNFKWHSPPHYLIFVNYIKKMYISKGVPNTNKIIDFSPLRVRSGEINITYMYK
jgi:hypothetical protein